MREGGVQVLKDSQNNVQLTVEWLKVPGGHHGGSWAARIKGVPMKQSAWLLFRVMFNPRSNIQFSSGEPMRLSVLYYFALEGLGSLDWESEQDENVRMSQVL